MVTRDNYIIITPISLPVKTKVISKYFFSYLKLVTCDEVQVAVYSELLTLYI